MVVGFATGTQSAGAVPSDGTSPSAPLISKASLKNPQLRLDEPLVLSIEFSDPQADFETISYGIDGESSHCTLPLQVMSKLTCASVVLELSPGNPIPGHYVLEFSLTDKNHNTSAVRSLSFAILNADGSLPVQASGGAPGTGGSASSGTGGRTYVRIGAGSTGGSAWTASTGGSAWTASTGGSAWTASTGGSGG